jgi:hypothetical protein
MLPISRRTALRLETRTKIMKSKKGLAWIMKHKLLNDLNDLIYHWRKLWFDRSKYMPHQGARECDRRRRRLRTA